MHIRWASKTHSIRGRGRREKNDHKQMQDRHTTHLVTAVANDKDLLQAQMARGNFLHGRGVERAQSMGQNYGGRVEVHHVHQVISLAGTGKCQSIRPFKKEDGGLGDSTRKCA